MNSEIDTRSDLREILDRTAKKIEVLRGKHLRPVNADLLEEFASARRPKRIPSAKTVARRQKAMRIVG